jgi:5'-methylthioadenosine phosphorylase
MRIPTPVHVKAPKGSIAESALISDDRDRVEDLSHMLTNCRLASDSRGFLIYTGKYKGLTVTLASHGIGGPSCAILVEEIIMLGAKRIVMFGTAAPLVPEINLGDYVVATEGRHPAGGLYEGYGAQDTVKTPDAALTKRLVETFRGRGLKVHTGSVYASDTYWAEDKDFARKRREEGNIAVEMESATLFMLGEIRHVATASVFIASNSVVGKAYIPKEQIESESREGAAAIFEALNAGARHKYTKSGNKGKQMVPVPK